MGEEGGSGGLRARATERAGNRSDKWSKHKEVEFSWCETDRRREVARKTVDFF